MRTEFIKLNVSEDVATAFREAPLEAQKEAAKKAREVLKYALMNRKDATREFERIASNMTNTASDRGLTEDELRNLLGNCNDE